MAPSDQEGTIRALLGNLESSFRLDRELGGRSLGDQLEDIIRTAANTELVEFGTPGDADAVRRRSDGAMRFFYRPHLFPGMDPALHLGHLVQYDLLPRELPTDSPIEAVAMLESYCHLSGDLFGWQSTGGGGIALWQLDVSGHGVRAGFAAVVFKLILAEADLELPLPVLAKQVERRFIDIRNPDDPGSLYATAAFLKITDGRSTEYLSAGHPPILVRRAADGSVERLEASTVPLALIPDIDAEAGRFDLAAADTVLISTDGLFELDNGDEAFGTDRAAAELAASDGSPIEVYRGISSAADGFHRLDRLDDDLSFIALRRKQ